MARSASARAGTPASFRQSIFMLVAGIGLLLGGGLTYDSSVDCGGQTMSQGDTCISTTDGKTSDNSLSQQQSSDNRTSIFLLVFGGIVGLVGAASLVSDVRRRNEMKAAGISPAGAAGISASQLQQMQARVQPQFQQGHGQPFSQQQQPQQPQPQYQQPQYPQPQYQQPQAPYAQPRSQYPNPGPVQYQQPQVYPQPPQSQPPA